MKITIVYDNCLSKPGLETGWGFSAVIEMENTPLILFDTGADGAKLLHNMNMVGIDPKHIATIVISHGHSDHTGGLWDILKINSEAEIYLPASFRGAVTGRKVTTVTSPLQISRDVFSTGELEGIEQSLALKTDSGLVVVTGCSHPGVGEIIAAASSLGRVYGIIGGLHGFHDFDRLKGLSLICPCHCTQYKSEIEARFAQHYVTCGAGLVIEL